MTQEKLTLVNQDAENVSSTQSQPKDTLMSFVPLVLIFVIFYFFIIRPQMKKQKEQQNLIKSAKKGDKVVAAGGIIGTIVKEKNQDIIEIEIAKNSTMEVMKSSILNILNKTAEKEKVQPKTNKKS